MPRALCNLEPAGFIKEFGGSIVPQGFLACDGSAISRSVYAFLFSIIGTTYGVGDGSTTFNIPDTRGRIPMGNTTASSGGTLAGSETVTLDSSNIASHTHGFTTGIQSQKHQHNYGTTSDFDSMHSHSVADVGHAHLLRTSVNSGPYNPRTWNAGGRTERYSQSKIGGTFITSGAPNSGVGSYFTFGITGTYSHNHVVNFNTDSGAPHYHASVSTTNTRKTSGGAVISSASPHDNVQPMLAIKHIVKY